MSNSKIYSNLSRLSIALPQKVLGNSEFSKFLGVSANWIQDNIGVRNRRICSGAENSIYLASLAAQQLLQSNSYDVVQPDWIIVTSATAEYQFPSMASLIKDYLNYQGVQQAFDLAGAGGGFINAVGIADNAIKSGSADNILVIGVDTLTKIVNWEDPVSTLFGDAAAAILISKANTKSILGMAFKTGMNSTDLFSLVNASTSEQIPRIFLDEVKFIKMASALIFEVVSQLLQQQGLEINEVDWIIPQQIHIKVINNFIDSFKVSAKQLICTIEEYGYTGAGSVLLGIAHAVQNNCFKPKDKILLIEVGAGLTAAAMLLEYSEASFKMIT